MRLSNVKSEQIEINQSIIDDYGEILTPNEVRSKVLKAFDSTVLKDGLIYGTYKGIKYCISCTNISYLGNPHPLHKKRIQIPAKFLDIFYENKKNNIRTLLIGIYSYKDNLLFCDFDTTKYINNKVHNSSAHVYSIDLLNATRSGYFQKKDMKGNIITVFNTKQINNYLNSKLLSSKDVTVEAFDTLDDFFASISKEWYGIEAYTEMIEANYNNKFQSEWPGFYLEYKLRRYLEENHKTDIISFYQNKKDGGIDLDLRFSQIGFYGDLKAHSIDSRGIQGNDYETIMNLLENQNIYYVVANHETEKDKNHDFVTTKFWNQKQNKTDLMSYSNKMKYSVKIKSYYILELNKYNKKYIDVYNQGQNSDGKKRNPKISINIKNINNFLVHIVEFDEKNVD